MRLLPTVKNNFYTIFFFPFLFAVMNMPQTGHTAVSRIHNSNDPAEKLHRFQGILRDLSCHNIRPTL